VVDREVVERLLALLENYLNDLKCVQGISFDEYERDTKTKRFVERTLQISVEACLDIGNHIITDEGFREPEDNRDIFKILDEENIIERALLPNLQQMASFRNLIVHNYGKIDDEIVFGILKRRLGDFSAFAGMIAKYLPVK
jgi:uncharacterized protein YutE (UPF0331/DUF86 family)